MPELPEVEIAARNLRAWSLGQQIVRIEVEDRARRLFRPNSPEEFVAHLIDRRIVEVRRLGKQLLWTLSREGTPPLGLIAHLGMTGKWLRRTPREATPRHSRVRLALGSGEVLHYRDPRLFGRLRLVPGARFEAVPELMALGPDPLEAGIDAERFARELARRRAPIKVALLDQALLAGVGNIQASEALFRARIDPRRSASSLSRREVGRLAEAVLASIRETLAREEGPEPSYVEEPGASNPFQVYAREGAPCPRCGGAPIRRLIQAQRSTFYCSRCQG